MDEDITVINTTTRNEKIKNFFINNKKKLAISLSLIILMTLSYFAYGEFDKRNKIKIANKYNNSIINFISGDKLNVENEMIKIINTKDKTYSPLALYFLLDNNIINSKFKNNCIKVRLQNAFQIFAQILFCSFQFPPRRRPWRRRRIQNRWGR